MMTDIRHWVYRFQGDYEGLVGDMNTIAKHNPSGKTEIINVQHVSGSYPKMDFMIFTRTTYHD
jgi:hypothetical protein